MSSSAGERSLDGTSLGTLQQHRLLGWWISKLVQFKVDTSTKVTAISEETYQLGGYINLHKTAKIIYGSGKEKLDVRMWSN